MARKDYLESLKFKLYDWEG